MVDSMPPVRGPDYEILGVSLVGPPPLGVFHLEWQSVLTVLYGPNGAGKSALLRGIRNALLGEVTLDGRAYLHIRLTGEAEPLDWEEDNFSNRIIVHIAEWIEEEVLHPGGWHFLSPHGHTWDKHEELLASDDPFHTVGVAIKAQWADTNRGEALAAAVEASRTFTLCAAGNRTWTILPSVPVGGDNAAVAELRDSLLSEGWQIENGQPRWPTES